MKAPFITKCLNFNLLKYVSAVVGQYCLLGGKTARFGGIIPDMYLLYDALGNIYLLNLAVAVRLRLVNMLFVLDLGHIQHSNT